MEISRSLGILGMFQPLLWLAGFASPAFKENGIAPSKVFALGIFPLWKNNKAALAVQINLEVSYKVLPFY